MARLTTPQLQQQLRTSLKNGGSFGTFMGIPSSIPYELAALAGFDWVICDLEHGENELAQVATAVVGFSGPVIVRVPSPSAENISRSLDRGAAGIMIPKISSGDDLDRALGFLDYPASGNRGVASYNRSGQWGHDGFALSGASPVAVVQVETSWAVTNIEWLAGEHRIDALFVGPLDLSYALGVPRDFDSYIFKRAIDQTLQAAKAAHRPIGILAQDGEAAKAYLDAGFSFVAIGSDTTTLLKAFKSNLKPLKDGN